MSWQNRDRNYSPQLSPQEQDEDEEEKEEVDPSLENQAQISFEKPPVKIENRKLKKFNFLDFTQRHPIITTLIAMFILIIIILIIVLPVTLVKRKEERFISPKCSDGKTQPKIDCLPDKAKLMSFKANLASICQQRKCCWSGSSENGAPTCSFPYNHGYRKTKMKEDTYSIKWIELLRLNSHNSFTKTDISNLETKIEMQTDNRLRIRVGFIFV
jgi:hypothetical protein